MIIKRQSERDFPRGAMRNGIIDGTKCQAEERKGNLFLLMCIAHTLDGSIKIQKALESMLNGTVIVAELDGMTRTTACISIL